MLFVFAFYATGGFLLFHVGQYFNTNYVYSDHSQKTILKFSQDALPVFIKKNKEFKFNGALYDVISKEEKNGFVYYTVVHDKHEMQLLNAVKQLISFNGSNADHAKNSKKSFTNFSVKDFIPQSNRLMLFHEPTALFFGIVNSAITSVSLAVITPPPRA